LPDDLSTGAAVLALRIAVVVALYLFVFAVFRKLRSELTQTSALEVDEPAEQAPADWIEVVDCEEAPDLAGKLYPLAPISSIGRERGNTVTIPDPRISSQHARLEWREGRWWIEDLDSANGTFLNGQAVGDPEPATHSDTIRVGPAVLRLRRPRRR
jgi:hypothetical protein